MSDKEIYILMIMEYFPDEHITIQNMCAHIKRVKIHKAKTSNTSSRKIHKCS